MFSLRKRPQHRSRLTLERLEDRLVPAAAPVLMVLPNNDFYYRDYSDTRIELEMAGLDVEVAAGTMDLCRPHGGSGQGADGGFVQPDMRIAEVDSSRYSAVVFVGGWGASAYQYAFYGTYQNPAYNGSQATRGAVTELIGDFLRQDKTVAAICYGVAALAWARVDGVSPLEGRTVSAYAGAAPGSTVADAATTRWHVEVNGAVMVSSGSVGNPCTVADDVIVDGNIITAEDWRSAAAFGRAVADQVLTAAETPPAPAEPLPVLLVIANRDFYFQEYNDTRASLEAAGLEVRVAAETLTWSVPHPGSGQGSASGYVMPDLTLLDARAADYSAIVFVGGWGSSSYQYAFAGTYQNVAYQGTEATKLAVNQLINDFVAEDKIVAGLCHGVTVLAYARVDGRSLLDGKTVSAYALSSPARLDLGDYENTTRWHVEANGATMVPSRSVGNPFTAADDVIVDGRIITGENFDSALMFGRVVAEQVLAS